MRDLKYFLELPDGSHRDESYINFSEAEKILREMDWKDLSNLKEDPTHSPFILFLDPEESFFMVLPETQGLLISCRVMDKWNLLGMLEKQKAYTLNYGVLDVDDTLRLLRLFYEDNYPSMRALEKIMAL